MSVTNKRILLSSFLINMVVTAVVAIFGYYFDKDYASYIDHFGFDSLNIVGCLFFVLLLFAIEFLVITLIKKKIIFWFFSFVGFFVGFLLPQINSLLTDGYIIVFFAAESRRADLVKVLLFPGDYFYAVILFLFGLGIDSIIYWRRKEAHR